MSALIPKVSQLSPRIIRILGCNPGPMTLQGTNTYLIGTGNRRVLFDTGEEGNKEYISNLVSVLKEQKTTIDKIIISHWHRDHIGGLVDVLGCLKDNTTTVHKYCRSDEPDNPLPDYIGLRHLKNNEEIRTDGATLRVHHTPGHTTDHVVLELAEEEAVFSGDCILGEGTAVFEDLHSYMGSLTAIRDLTPKVIYPGHGPVLENPLPKIDYYIEHRNMREKQITETLANSEQRQMTAMELVKIIYKETPEHLHPAAEFNVIHHLEKLCKDHLIYKSGEHWGLNSRKGQL